MKLVPRRPRLLPGLAHLPRRGHRTARRGGKFERGEWLAAPSQSWYLQGKGSDSGRRGLELKRNGNGPRPRQDDCDGVSLFLDGINGR